MLPSLQGDGIGYVLKSKNEKKQFHFTPPQKKTAKYGQSHQGYLFRKSREGMSSTSPETRELLKSKSFLAAVCEEDESLRDAREVSAAVEIQRHIRGYLTRRSNLRASNKSASSLGLTRTQWLTSNDVRRLSVQVHHCLVEKMRVGRELALARSLPRRRVCVVGGGPVGLKAAIEAVSLGHQVTLLEEKPENLRARNVGIHIEDQEFLASLGNGSHKQ